MSRVQNRGRIVAMLASLTLVAAGCGGDDDSSGVTEPPEVSETTSVSDDVDEPEASATTETETETADPSPSAGETTAPETVEPTTPANTEPVRISLSLPLTGPLAFNGNANKDGFEFYFKQNGGTAGGRPVEILVTDTTAAPDVAVQLAQTAIERDQVDVLAGYVSSSEALAVRDLAVRAEIPLVVTQAATSQLIVDDDPGSAFVSQLLGTFDTTMPVITQRAIDDGHTRIVFMGTDFEAGRDSEAAVRATAEANGAEVIESIFAPLGNPDFGPLFGNIPDDADAAVVFFAGADAVRFVEQYKEFGLTGDLPLYSHWALTIEPLLAQQTAEAAVGITVVSEYSPTIDNPTNAAFVEAWQAEFGFVPSGWNIQGYTAAMAIDEALKANPNATGADLAAAIHAVELDAPQGSVSFADNGRMLAPIYIARVEDTTDGLRNVIIDQVR